MGVRIRTMQPEDWQAVAAIYLEGIQTGVATFQTEAPAWEAWDEGHLKGCRLVAIDEDEKVIGWVALSAVSGRCVYKGVAEVSIYVGKDSRGKGVGKLLLEELIRQSEDEGIWTIQAGVFANNTASLNLHLQVGFKKVGVRERIGRTVSGKWQDTVLLERRSDVVGID